ncbi:MAG: lipid A deacylase LpxR family protein [Granulosicoccus sp.]|nr:lipid A deacylase LpxR family protein [Granulosicoccus sp.]
MQQSTTLIISTLLFICTSHASASKLRETVTFRLENDIFTGSDNQYTNGVAITWSSKPLDSYEQNSHRRRWGELFKFLPGFSTDAERRFLVLSLIHEMNTPSDITMIDPPLGEQPYSGILMLSNTVYSNLKTWSQAWNLRVGVVGPVTRSGDLQTAVHTVIDSDQPQGWETQLQNELILNIGYIAGKTMARRINPASFSWRALTLGSLEFGNYTTSIGGNFMVEFGQFSPRTLSNSSIGSSLPSIIGVGSSPTQQFEVAAYIGVGAYALAHYMPLDGTVFRSSRSADYSPFVTTASLGITARYEKLIVSLSANIGSTPLNKEDPNIDYGGLTFGWVFD